MLFYLQMLLRLLQLQLSCCFYCGHCYYHSHRRCVEVYFKIFTVASIALGNTTAIVTTVVAIIRPLSLLLAAITIVVKTALSQQCFIFLFYFSLAMTMVRAMAKATVTMTAMAMVMIYHHLFHNSNETIAAFIYFSFFS
jgi:hypothetical protein